MDELMSRNFGMSSRETAGGFSQSRGSHHAPNSTQRNPSIPPLPSGSIAGSPPFKRGGFLQTLIDIAALVLGALFICIGAISVSVAVFILFFVRLG